MRLQWTEKLRAAWTCAPHRRQCPDPCRDRSSASSLVGLHAKGEVTRSLAAVRAGERGRCRRTGRSRLESALTSRCRFAFGFSLFGKEFRSAEAAARCPAGVPSVGGQNLRNRVDSFSSVRPHSVSLYWSGTRPSVRCPRAGPEQNASCRSAAAFSANPMSNRQRAEEQQVQSAASWLRRRLLADDGLDAWTSDSSRILHAPPVLRRVCKAAYYI